MILTLLICFLNTDRPESIKYAPLRSKASDHPSATLSKLLRQKDSRSLISNIDLGPMH